MHDTPPSPLSVYVKEALGWTVHDVPFHRSASATDRLVVL
jgi:hypothetical protein